MKWSSSFHLPQDATHSDARETLLRRAETDLKARLDQDPHIGRKVRLWREAGAEELQIESPWISGVLRFTATHLHVDAQLSFAAWAFRGQIEGILKSWVESCRIL